MADGLGLGDVSYERAKALACDSDPAVRRALAEREDVGPEILYYLAEDSDAGVRRAVALNAAAPRQTDLLLARDRDESVREGLAEKIAAVAPGLTAAETNKVRAQTYEALAVLAKDQLTEVRGVLAEALKDVVDAPSDIVKALAMDLEIAVSRPVLEHSPVLTDADLIELVGLAPAVGAVGAIARRRGLSEDVADAIIGTDDVDGIADLLGNASAQIREEALDDLILRADNVELWHAPLVARPRLPAGAAQRMAGFLADNLLQVLESRNDLDDSAVTAIKNAFKDRVGNVKSMSQAVGPGVDFLKVEPPLPTVENLRNTGKLNAEMMIRALQAGDQPFVFAAIILLSGVAVGVARKIFMEKNPKAIVALCVRAKLPPQLTVMVQQKMGRIAPSQVIGNERSGLGTLDLDDLNWQIEFYTDMTERGSF